MAFQILNDPTLSQIYLSTHFGNPCDYINNTLNDINLYNDCSDILNEHFSLVKQLLFVFS